MLEKQGFNHWHRLCYIKAQKRTTPPVFAFELAAALFFKRSRLFFRKSQTAALASS
jgi:hypothetical protein